MLTSAGLGLTHNLAGKIFTGTQPEIKIRAITKGPKFYWFGYYDKFQFDVSGRYALGMAVDFEGRSPLATDTIEIGMVDLANGDKCIALGTSSSWGWQ